jgi:hypothetical protein
LHLSKFHLAVTNDFETSLYANGQPKGERNRRFASLGRWKNKHMSHEKDRLDRYCAYYCLVDVLKRERHLSTAQIVNDFGDHRAGIE